MVARRRWPQWAAFACAMLLWLGRAYADDRALLGRPNPLARLFPSAGARAAAEQQQLEAKLKRALQSLPGVRNVEATLSVTASDRVALDQPLPPPRATVVLHVRGTFDEPQARSVAQTLLPAGSELRLTTIPSAADAVVMQPSAPNETKKVGPFQVAADSAGWLRGTLAALLVSNALLALLLLRGRVTRH